MILRDRTSEHIEELRENGEYPEIKCYDDLLTQYRDAICLSLSGTNCNNQKGSFIPPNEQIGI